MGKASRTDVVSRRDFLRAAAAVPLAFFGAGSSRVCYASPARRHEIGFYVDPLDHHLSDRLAFLKERGVRFVGADGMARKDPETIKKIADVFERSGLSVVSVHGETGMATMQEDEHQLHAAHEAILARAIEWNASEVVLHFRQLSIPWREGVWWDEAAFINEIGLEKYDRRVASFLEWLCERADHHNLRIAMENVPLQHQFGYRIDEMITMIESVGAPNLGICLDSGHAHASSLDVANAVRRIGRHLTSLHLHDNFGGGDPRATIKDTDRHLVPGLGTINWPKVINALDEVGFSGPTLFEGVRIPGQGWEQAVELTIANWHAFEQLAAD